MLQTVKLCGSSNGGLLPLVLHCTLKRKWTPTGVIPRYLTTQRTTDYIQHTQERVYIQHTQERVYIQHCCTRSLSTTDHLEAARSTIKGDSPNTASPPRVCVVGSGPSGMYTTKELLKRHSTLHVDIFEKLPAFWGLARYGVAPDHEDTKNCINDFERIANSDRVRIFGNVEVGARIPLEVLRQSYDAIVLACGVGSEQRLRVQPNNLGGVFTSEDIVDWYNCVPRPGTHNSSAAEEYFAKLNRLKCQRAVIIGQGNVSLDIARLLLKCPKRLSGTDIDIGFHRAVVASPVNRIDIVGRRGWVQAAMTTSELRKLMVDEADDILVVVNPDEYALSLDAISKEELSNDNARKRMQPLFEQAVKNWEKKDSFNGKVLAFRFMLSLDLDVAPHSEDSSCLGSVALIRNKLVGTLGRLGAVQDDNNYYKEVIPTSLLISCTGRKLEASSLIPALLVTSTNKLKQDDGRIYIPDSVDTPQLADSSSPPTVRNESTTHENSTPTAAQLLTAIYCVGWLRTGGRGTIAAHILHARRLAARIVEDLGSIRLDGRNAVAENLENELANSKDVMRISMWERVKEYESGCGRTLGKSAVKLLREEDFFAVGHGFMQH